MPISPSSSSSVRRRSPAQGQPPGGSSVTSTAENPDAAIRRSSSSSGRAGLFIAATTIGGFQFIAGGDAEVVKLEELDATFRAVTESLTARLADQGARAVVLTGSVARGTAEPDSDVDLFAVGDGPREQHEVVDGRLVGSHWFTPEEVRRRLADPERAPLTARAWKDALLLYDPDGVAAELQQEAERWRWDDIGAHADVWAREQLVGWAEYLPKLRRAVEDGRALDASAMAAETALKLAHVSAVATRVCAGSENGFWEAVAEHAGPRWRTRFETAVGARAGSVRESAEAAVDLYELVVARVAESLAPQEQAVVDRALETARFPSARTE